MTNYSNKPVISEDMVEKAAAAFAELMISWWGGHAWHKEIRNALEAVAQDIFNQGRSEGLKLAVHICNRLVDEIESKSGDVSLQKRMIEKEMISIVKKHTLEIGKIINGQIEQIKESNTGEFND